LSRFAKEECYIENRERYASTNTMLYLSFNTYISRYFLFIDVRQERNSHIIWNNRKKLYVCLEEELMMRIID